MKNQNPIICDAFQCLRLYPKIVPGALKKCGITKARQDYDDLKSEGQLSFVAAYYACMQRPLQLQFVNFNNVLGFISRAVVWDLKHILRKERRYNFYHGGPQILGLLKPAPDPIQQVDETMLYRDLYKRCSAEELTFLRLRITGCTTQQIADHLGISVRQVHRIRHGLEKWLAPHLLD